MKCAEIGRGAKFFQVKKLRLPSFSSLAEERLVKREIAFVRLYANPMFAEFGDFIHFFFIIPFILPGLLLLKQFLHLIGAFAFQRPLGTAAFIEQIIGNLVEFIPPHRRPVNNGRKHEDKRPEQHFFRVFEKKVSDRLFIETDFEFHGMFPRRFDLHRKTGILACPFPHIIQEIFAGGCSSRSRKRLVCLELKFIFIPHLSSLISHP